MPLMVEYREKSYAAGMIPPTFTRRESMCVLCLTMIRVSAFEWVVETACRVFAASLCRAGHKTAKFSGPA